MFAVHSLCQIDTLIVLAVPTFFLSINPESPENNVLYSCETDKTFVVQNRFLSVINLIRHAGIL
jgi:hypothetical protein